MRKHIIQDPDELMEKYAGNLTYDVNDRLFMAYFRYRTGIQMKGGEQPDRYYNGSEMFMMILQWRLQDCWELLHQPGFREKFAIERLKKGLKK